MSEIGEKTTEESAWRVYGRRLVRSAVGWSLMLIPISIHRYFTGWLGEPGQLSGALLNQLDYLLAWTLATPLFVEAAHRFPPSGPRRMRNLAVHAGIGLGFALLLNLYSAVVTGDGIGFREVTSLGFDRFLFFAPFVLGVYAIIVLGTRLRAGPTEWEGPAPAGASPEQRLVAITEQYRTHLVPIESINRIEADGHHVLVHTSDRTYRPRTRFSGLLGQLDSAGLVRIHRSHAVRAEFVSEFQTYLHGDAFVVLKDGTRLRVSRTYRAEVERHLTGGS